MKNIRTEYASELHEAVRLFVSQPLNNPLTRGQIMEVAKIALPILEQQERGEGEWIEWGGGAMPVSDKSWIDIKWIDGSISRNTFAAIWDWEHRPGADNIIAYRIIPEQPTNQNGEQ